MGNGDTIKLANTPDRFLSVYDIKATGSDSIRFYTEKGRHGWFDINYMHPYRGGEPSFIVGVRPIYPNADWVIRQHADGVNVQFVFACLDNGVPRFDWCYFVSWRDNSNKFEKNENYENGKLHGLFKINSSVFQYETVFEHGTGDYLDVFPDGAVRRQGRLVGSMMDGVWYFYAYRRDEGYLFRIAVEYDMGEELAWWYEIPKNGGWKRRKAPGWLRREYESLYH